MTHPYKRLYCLFSECEDQFSVYFEHNAEGATPDDNIVTIHECAKKCRSSKDCVAFDFDYNDDPHKDARCWIHDNPQIKMKQLLGVAHYPRNTCVNKIRKLSLYLFINNSNVSFLCDRRQWMKVVDINSNWSHTTAYCIRIQFLVILLSQDT